MNLALKIRTDARRQVREKIIEFRTDKKLKQKSFFNRLYDKPKEIKFKTMKEASMVKHFYFPKIKDGWGFGFHTPLSGLAVYPVICSKVDFRDYDRWFQLPMKGIAKLAGLSINTASKGVRHFEEVEYRISQSNKEGEFQFSHYLVQRKMETDGERHFYVYRAGFIRGDMISNWRDEDNPENADFFKFNTWIIDTGVWAKLKGRAKALYIALRSCSRFDEKLYAGIENDVPIDDLDHVEFDPEEYKNRKWEVCTTPTAQLCRMVGINGSDIRKIVDDLEEHGLVEKFDKWYKVWLQPNPLYRNFNNGS